MQYAGMTVDDAELIKNEFVDEFATLLAEGHNGRDIAQAMVESVAMLVILHTGDQLEANKLATHMVIYAQELANKINRPAPATIMNGH